MSFQSHQTGRVEEVFYSYAHKDQRLRSELDKHLSSLKRQGLISGWHDRNINAGEEWKLEIDKHLNSASIILLLISPDFMASDYCYSREMKRALERHETEEAIVIPIILRPVDWENAPFSYLQVLPSNDKPVTLWRNQDQAFLKVAKGIRTVVNQLQEAKSGKKTSAALGREIWEEVALVHFDKGETLFERGDYKGALIAFDEAIKYDYNRENIYAYLSKGHALFELNRFREALEDYTLAISLNHPYVYMKMGDTFLKLGQYEEASKYYDKAIELDPNNTDLYVKQGDMLYGIDRNEEALIAYDKAIDLNPDNANLYAKQGANLTTLKRYEEALIAYNQVIQLNPQNTTSYTIKGLILEHLGRTLEALQTYDIIRKQSSPDQEPGKESYRS